MQTDNSPQLKIGDAVLDVNLLMEGFTACENYTSGDIYKHTRYVASFLQLLESAVLHEHIWPNVLWGEGEVFRKNIRFPLEKILYQEGVLVNYKGLATLTNIEALNSRISVYSQIHENKTRTLEDIALSETAHVQVLPDFDNLQEYSQVLLLNREKLYQPILERVYSSLSQNMQNQVDEIKEYTHSNEVFIPPISWIILSKASTLKDIPEVLLETRKKAAKIRSAFSEYETILSDPNRPLKNRLRILRDIQLITTELSKPYDSLDTLHLTEWPDIWGLIEDVSEGGLSPIKIVGKLLDKPLASIVKRLRLRNAHYLFSLKQHTLSGSGHFKRINQLFGQAVDEQVLIKFLRTSK